MKENDLFPLSQLAPEIRLYGGVARGWYHPTPDELAVELANEVIVADAVGRPCVNLETARRLIEAEAQRKHEVAEAARRREVERRERVRDLQRKRPVPRGVQREVPEGLTPARAMTAQDGPPLYSGGAYTPRPNAVDWVFGSSVEGGASFGPSRAEMARQARERAAARKGKRGAK